MKTIVAKTQIQEDRQLAIVKAFRITNKRAGEAKRAAAAAENDDDREPFMETYKEKCEQLRQLSEQAEAEGFHIWVNGNGKTGHTLDRDYKVTMDADNNYEKHQAEVEQAEGAMAAILGNLLGPNQQN